MAKSPDAFRTISEVATWLGVQAHVLRFWESKFTQVKPVKRAGGRRYYRPSDMRLIGGIKTLLHDDGMTIKGVQKILREQGVAHVSSLSPPLDGEAVEDAFALDVTPPQEERGTVVAFKAKPIADAAVSRPRAPAEQPPSAQQMLPLDDPAPAQESDSPGEEITSATPEAGGLPPVETMPERESLTTEEAATAEPAPATPEPAPEAQSPAAAKAPDDPVEVSAEGSVTPAPEDTPTAAPLPGFLNPDRPASPMATPPQAPEQTPSLRVVAIADPLHEDAQSYTPGLLGHLAGIDRLSRLQAARIAPFVRALRDWYERQEKATRG
ncbi:MerR family transcriptional regulator [Pseudodonghicola flavimaris]|uniref:MerR family transcriptional regulator n=1 Tax=Pseudodonghicola flavimaris TaxID=3050036 RepID=A0ABT7EVH5_9RHOB|nr:MerR family transcriptional regulator [Pseudodonghicola flavimaris]MDK3016348.1 MerR family transcriptional regulator [Pseudodonghicola flavimaris]